MIENTLTFPNLRHHKIYIIIIVILHQFLQKTEEAKLLLYLLDLLVSHELHTKINDVEMILIEY